MPKTCLLLSYPDAYLDYQVPDIFNPSYLFGAQPNYSIEPYGRHHGAHSNPSHRNSSISTDNALDFPKPHDDLSHFLSGSSFSSPTSGQRYAALVSNAPDSWDLLPGTAPAAPVAILTSAFKPFEHHTVMNQRQVKPGGSPKVSPESPRKSEEAAPAAQRQLKNGTEVAAAAAAVARAVTAK